MANLLPSVYLNRDIKYLKNVNIVEYDMKSAGLSILRAKHAISEEKVQELLNMPKEERNIAIGVLEHNNKEILEIKNAGFKEYITRFVFENGINLSNILTIKKDAIFLINCNPTIFNFDEYVNFEPKNVYTSYCLLNGKEFYYNGNTRKIDVKGLGKEVAESIANGPLKDIANILHHSECNNKLEMFKYLKDYRSRYINKKLRIESYRDIDTGFYLYKDYKLENIEPEYMNSIQYSDNYIKYIRELIIAII